MPNEIERMIYEKKICVSLILCIHVNTYNIYVDNRYVNKHFDIESVAI